MRGVDNEREAWSNQRVGETGIAISLSIGKDGAIHRRIKLPGVFGPARYDSMRDVRRSVVNPTGSSDIAFGPSENGVEKMHILYERPTT